MVQLSQGVIEDCQEKLLRKKADVLNQLSTLKFDFYNRPEKGGDEADMSSAIIQEHQILTITERLRSQLLEIELALKRISEGRYGLCEETEELIEVERLKTIPWTTLSIEGAEIREFLRTKFAF